MSYQEKRSLSNIVMTVLITVVYVLVTVSKYNNGDFDTSNEMKLWSTLILWFIPISVAARIILTILFRIFSEIGREISGNKEDNIDLVDERDKLIELKANRISLVVFGLGFIIALFTQAFDASISVFFITFITGGVLSEVLGNVFEVIYHRRGV